MRTTIAASILLCACATAPTGPFATAIGTWTGHRIDAATGNRAEMTMTVHPILGGNGTFEQLEIHGDNSTYRGATMTAYDQKQRRWVKQYVNSSRGRFVRIEGTPNSPTPGDIWHVVSDKRRARLTSKRSPDGRWLRIMHVGDIGSTEWRELWRDELVRR